MLGFSPGPFFQIILITIAITIRSPVTEATEMAIITSTVLPPLLSPVGLDLPPFVPVRGDEVGTDESGPTAKQIQCAQF